MGHQAWTAESETLWCCRARRMRRCLARSGAALFQLLPVCVSPHWCFSPHVGVSAFEQLAQPNPKGSWADRKNLTEKIPRADKGL